MPQDELPQGLNRRARTLSIPDIVLNDEHRLLEDIRLTVALRGDAGQPSEFASVPQPWKLFIVGDSWIGLFCFRAQETTHVWRRSVRRGLWAWANRPAAGLQGPLSPLQLWETKPLAFLLGDLQRVVHSALGNRLLSIELFLRDCGHSLFKADSAEATTLT